MQDTDIIIAIHHIKNYSISDTIFMQKEITDEKASLSLAKLKVMDFFVTRLAYNHLQTVQDPAIGSFLLIPP